MSAFDIYKALLPHPDVVRMHGPNAKPTYDSIEAVVVQLNANAIHPNSIDRKLGHLILAVGNKE